MYTPTESPYNPLADMRGYGYRAKGKGAPRIVEKEGVRVTRVLTVTSVSGERPMHPRMNRARVHTTPRGRVALLPGTGRVDA